MNIEKITNMMCDFVSYVDDFYNEKSGIYPIKGMTDMMVIKAVQKHVTSVGMNFCADSVDREKVRDIILADNNLVWSCVMKIDILTGMTKHEIQIALQDLYIILTDLGFTDTATAINCAEDTLMGEGDE